MEDKQLVATLIDSTTTKIQQLQKAFAELESHRAVTLNLKWKELEEHFHGLEKSLKRRFHELEDQEKEFETKTRKSREMLKKREAAVVAKEQASLVRLQEKRDAAVFAISNALEKQRKESPEEPADSCDGDSGELSVEEKPPDSVASESNSEDIKFSSENGNFRVKSYPQLVKICEEMDSEGLHKFISDNRKNLAALKEEIPWALKAAASPAYLALNPRFSNYTVGEFKHILGVKPTPKKELLGIPIIRHDKSIKMPANFDARTAWPQCSTIGRILDQGHCGSCWAFGAVESLSDRFCIHFGMNISLSVNDLLACCGFLCGSGCDGGVPISAWRYFVHSGVVTEECDPYFDDIGCSHPGCEPAYPTPMCEKKCVKGNQLWSQSKHYSVGAYRINSDPTDIMAEVYKNGPVEVAFTVYEDFAHYKSGVYKHVTGSVMGGHAVKLIGWGTSDDGEDYWLLANQWNKGWGEDGYFKITRGTNECGIEDDVVAGLPSTKNLVREVADMDILKAASF